MQMGGTVPNSLSSSNIQAKMDLRITTSTAPIDFAMTEFAKECTASKYYLDKLKLVLLSKLHLNSWVKHLKSDPKTIRIPLIQIMGFDCHVLHLVLIKPRQYMVVKVSAILVTVTPMYGPSDHSKFSHCENLPNDITTEFGQLRPTTDNNKDYVRREFSEIIKKIDWIKAKLNHIEKINPTSNIQRCQKGVFRYILNQHQNKPALFYTGNVRQYSEEDFKIKFWSHIFEEVFGYDQIDLKWADTITNSSSNTNVQAKMD
ncbi:hypothetical protein INT47_006357 [Mucor saturninus]|uniref:Uncharacterized protein n=1 Tax=Mucor saturninus TaxID=64648 RepID=A0A8H7VA69_9FUNG|nr:hypothetical protein INT47_006357 [Mucor saturninus]